VSQPLHAPRDCRPFELLLIFSLLASFVFSCPCCALCPQSAALWPRQTVGSACRARSVRPPCARAPPACGILDLFLIEPIWNLKPSTLLLDPCLSALGRCVFTSFLTHSRFEAIAIAFPSMIVIAMGSFVSSIEPIFPPDHFFCLKNACCLCTNK